jgi:hypothetical protein
VATTKKLVQPKVRLTLVKPFFFKNPISFIRGEFETIVDVYDARTKKYVPAQLEVIRV